MAMGNNNNINVGWGQGEPRKILLHMPEKRVMPWIHKDFLLPIDEVGVTVVGGRIKPKKSVEIFRYFHGTRLNPHRLKI